MSFVFTGYNQSYLDESQRRAETQLSKRIVENRWDMVQYFCHIGTVIDYGCGAGVFHKAAPEPFVARGYDINPASDFCDPKLLSECDILTLWDVLEHIPDPTTPFTQCRPQWVFISTPNADDALITKFKAWKHFKPWEHLHYYTPKTLAMFMGAIGYNLQHYDFSEGALRDCDNKKAVFSAVFRKCLDS